MRSMPAPLLAWLAANQARYWADTYKITLYDATVLRWTSADVSFSVGGFTYSTAGANGPAIKRGLYEQSSRLTIDTMDITLTGGAFTIGGKTLPQLAAAGYFDFARVQVDHLTGPDLPGALALGPIPSLFEGPIAGIDLQGPDLILRAKSELDTLANLQLPRFPLQPQCGNAVYDPNCGLNRATFTDTGSASGSPTRSVIQSTSAPIGTRVNAFYNLGVLAFTSGVNNGSRRAVKTFTASAGTATITVSLPFPVAPGLDNFSIYPGCDRSKARCGNNNVAVGPAFNNLAQYRGFPHIPTPESGA